MKRPATVRTLRALPEPQAPTVPDNSRVLATLTVAEWRALQEELARDQEPPTVPAGSRLVSGAELGELLGCSRTQVHRLRTEGLPAVRVGDVFRYEPERVLQWLRERSTK